MNELFSNLDVALFDLDGTLVETNIDFAVMRREMVRIALDSGLAEPHLDGLDILAIVERFTDHIRARRGETAAEKTREEAFLILEDIEIRHSADAREIVPARELVEALQARGVKVGIVTRNCRAASEESLARAGIPADAMVCREDVPLTKPNPDHLRCALERLSASPRRSIMIGDHLMDIAAGKAAGMRTIGLLTAGRPSDYFSSIGPDAVARDLSEILRAVVDSHS